MRQILTEWAVAPAEQSSPGDGDQRRIQSMVAKGACMTMHYTGALLGREAVIQFPESTAQVRYSVRGDLHWCVTDKNGNVTQGNERLSYLQLSDTLHFLNWIEKTGFTVSQVIDTENGTVKAFWSYADEFSERGHRASMFVDGTFHFV
ncbi:hypothetical protein N5D37_13685 [Comamonas aquatica]|uniref:MoaF-related domain-containing protein n=1 Tax=Comamonas aquatica TaxID=225991 RepID=UPI00244A4487|nr:hypothetical protein [Comamonas aquatica]MDH1766665.1 hypothetical protein [Comamonas aquatica]